MTRRTIALRLVLTPIFAFCVIWLACLLAAHAQAPDAGPGHERVATVDAAAVAPAAAAPVTVTTDATTVVLAGPVVLPGTAAPVPTDEAAFSGLAKAIEQFGSAKTLAGAERRKAIGAGIAALSAFLIWLLRRKFVIFLNEQVVICCCACIALIAAAAFKVGAGCPTWQSIETALYAGPGAMFLQSLTKLPSKDQWVKADAKAKMKALERGLLGKSADPAPPGAPS